MKFVDPGNPGNFAEAIDNNTKALFCETVSNPACQVADLEAIAKIAHDHGIPLIVDATFSTPALTRPIEHGPTSSCIPRPNGLAVMEPASGMWWEPKAL